MSYRRTRVLVFKDKQMFAGFIVHIFCWFFFMFVVDTVKQQAHDKCFLTSIGQCTVFLYVLFKKSVA